MAADISIIPDPRVYAGSTPGPWPADALYALADASLGAETRLRSDALDRALLSSLSSLLAADDGRLPAAMSNAPSASIARHLWRLLDLAWREVGGAGADDLALTLFAIPVVIVTGVDGEREDGTLAGVLDAPERLADVLSQDGALAGNTTLAFSNALAPADAIDLGALPRIHSWRCRVGRGDGRKPTAALDLPPAPMAFHRGRESVHLRFMIGSAMARRGADLLAESRVGRWGVPFARELARQLAMPGVTLLALPRAPRHLLPAAAEGRSAQREVSAQLFASNAIRTLRATTGEPTAVISAHRSADAPGGGELRLSLSSPFSERGAEGFRCPLYVFDGVGDVASMLVDLLRDCRVTDIRTLPGVHPDLAPGTALPLLFKPDTIPDGVATPLH